MGWVLVTLRWVLVIIELVSLVRVRCGCEKGGYCRISLLGLFGKLIVSGGSVVVLRMRLCSLGFLVVWVCCLKIGYRRMATPKRLYSLLIFL